MDGTREPSLFSIPPHRIAVGHEDVHPTRQRRMPGIVRPYKSYLASRNIEQSKFLENNDLATPTSFPSLTFFLSSLQSRRTWLR